MESDRKERMEIPRSPFATIRPVDAVKIGNLRCGGRERLLVIAGPCVLESRELTFQIAEQLKSVSDQLGFDLVFKASFDKANRTSVNAYRGLGLDAGLRLLEEVGRELELPTTTDIHLPNQAQFAADCVDLLQIPAFLARQTDLLLAAAQTGKPVNVKKGQFMAPSDMRYVVEKLRDAGAAGVLLCERGTFFGYGSLVNDFQSLPSMRELGVPVVFDATHSVQQPGGLAGATGGKRDMVWPLARAAVAAGVDAVFLETHPDPDQSPSDGPNMVPLRDVEELMKQLTEISNLASNW